MASAFFEPAGQPGRFVATGHCAGPWDPGTQHAGPPSALLAHSIERFASSVAGPTQITRFSVDILRPVPVGEVTVTVSTRRPGRSVELVEAELAAAGRIAMVARAWRMRVARVRLPVPAGVVAVDAVLPGFPQGPIELPEIPQQEVTPYRLPMWNTGYADAVDWRFVTGSAEGNSPATAWARPRVSLVAGEESTALAKLVLLADAGNGLSRVLDIDTWWFINTELTVHLHRQPVGDWFLVAARSIVESLGAGLAETELFDTLGRVGRGAQSLMVGPR